MWDVFGTILVMPWHSLPFKSHALTFTDKTSNTKTKEKIRKYLHKIDFEIVWLSTNCVQCPTKINKNYDKRATWTSFDDNNKFQSNIQS